MTSKGDVPGLIEQFSLLNELRDPREVRHRIGRSGGDLRRQPRPCIRYPSGVNRLDGLRRFLTLKHGIPSKDTVEWSVEIIHPEARHRLFLEWTDQLPLPALPEEERERVAIEGKTSRGFPSPGLQTLPPVKIFGVQHRVLLRADGVPEKTNEITVLANARQN